MEIIADSIRAIQIIHNAAILEELRLFAVADRVVEHFLTGLLPVGRGPAGERLDRYWKERPERLAEAERRQLYSRALGLGSGADSDPTANRELEGLWLRFVSAVSALDEARVARMDLARNLSLHGWGGTTFAAARLADQVRDAVDLLSDPEIGQAYGARDMWQVVERVSHLYLGAVSNVSRQRSRLEAGHHILEWLADSAAVPEPDLADESLVNAAERWLAVHGEADEPWRPRGRAIRAETLRQVETLFSCSRAASQLPPAARARLIRQATRIGETIVKARTEAAGGLISQVDFPHFVAGLIEGTFHAVVDSSVRQMEAYAELVASVARSVDQFVDDAREPACGRSTLAETLLKGTTHIVVSDGGVKPCVRPGRAKAT